MTDLIKNLDCETIDLDLFKPNDDGWLVLECVQDSSESVIIRQKQMPVSLSIAKDPVEQHGTDNPTQNNCHPKLVSRSKTSGLINISAISKSIHLKTSQPHTKVIINLETNIQVKFFWTQFIESEKRELTLNLLKPNTRVELYCITHLKESVEVENRLTINHIAPDCQSFTLFKGVLAEQAKSSFFGKIYVTPEAHNTDAKLSNHNILLSDRAFADSKPELEIYCDDVKCTHGATIGHFDQNQDFYLQSRGVRQSKRQAMLTEAFLQEIISKITI